MLVFLAICNSIAANSNAAVNAATRVFYSLARNDLAPRPLPLYYQYYKFPPAYPFKYGNWYAIAWAGIGVAVTALVVWLRPQRLRDVDRVYVEDETVPPDERGFPTA